MSHKRSDGQKALPATFKMAVGKKIQHYEKWNWNYEKLYNFAK